MPDMWMDVDTAVTVPVNIMPLLDDTDFKSREVSIAFDAAGMDLSWNFVSTAGVSSNVGFTPTTGSNHDWTHNGDGMYKVEIPASGGTVNNENEGVGWITGVCTGVLPWRGPTIGFRSTALNNMFIDGGTSATNLDNFFNGTGYVGGTAKLTVDLVAIGGVAQSATDLKDFADDGYDPATNKVQGVVLVDTLTTYTGNTPQTGDSFARLGAPAGASVSADIAAIEAQTDDIGAAGAGLTAVPWNAAWDAEVQSEVNDALVANNLDHLCLTPVADTQAMAEVVDNTIIGNILSKSASTTSYDPTTDSLEAVSDKLGVAGAGLTAIPWNAAWDAEVQSEVDDALVAQKLDHLVAVADADDAVDNSIIAKLASKSATADWSTYNNQTDSHEATRDIIGTPAGASVSADIAAVKAETAAIVDDTGTSGVVLANDAITAAKIAADAIGASELAADAATEIADAILDRNMATGTDSGSTTVRTVRQALRILRNKVSESGGTLTITKEDDTTSSWTAAVTTDAAANPITVVDPAGP